MQVLKRLLLRFAVFSLLFSSLAFFSAPLYGQYGGEDALAKFPADTQQMAYTNLEELRQVPQFPLIQAHLLSPELRNLENLLNAAGINPNKDVNELVLGWRGQVQDTARFFGLAEGSFDPDQVHEYFVNNKMPVQHYGGYDLYGFGSGAPRTAMFFTFLSGSTAEFGRLEDIKVLIDVQNATRPALNSNPDFRRWEGDLQGLAPQWGIATGLAAANEAIPWLTQGKKISVNPSALFGSVKAVLYRVNWGDQIMAHLSIICRSPEAANGFNQLLTLLQNAQPAIKKDVSPALSQILQNMDVRVNGSRLDLDASASISSLSQLLNAPAGSTGTP